MRKILCVALLVVRLSAEVYKSNNEGGGFAVSEASCVPNTTSGNHPDHLSASKVDGAAASSGPIVLVNNDCHGATIILGSVLIASDGTDGADRDRTTQWKSSESHWRSIRWERGFECYSGNAIEFLDSPANRSVNIFTDSASRVNERLELDAKVRCANLPSILWKVDSSDRARFYSIGKRQAFYDVRWGHEFPIRPNEESGPFDRYQFPIWSSHFHANNRSDRALYIPYGFNKILPWGDWRRYGDWLMGGATLRGRNNCERENRQESGTGTVSNDGSFQGKCDIVRNGEDLDYRCEH
ncbi:MAG: hypothetical protein ABJF23_33640 [Bryobacteraceae bacterium]